MLASTAAFASQMRLGLDASGANDLTEAESLSFDFAYARPRP